ncbi:MAG: type I 3-dehydroquinate dehydratase [Clostridia bacterium]|nr:type I 3-dehydroquinate dehydratase [Clostridia bacterium]
MTHTPTFLGQNRPLNTCLIQINTVAEARDLARNGAFAGCDAFAFQAEQITPAERTEKNIKSIFAQMGSRPIYVTNYRKHANGDASDDELLEGLLDLRRWGATLLDVMGDYYDPTPGELTMDPAAIEKQNAAIARIHEAGGEVLMSSHVLKFIPAEEVLRIALEHQRRGADIAKIVTGATSDEEELENLRITALLKRELDIPFLFLSGGTHNQRHRLFGPMFGSVMWLSVPAHHRCSTKSQPLCRAVRDIAAAFPW